jgi:hypothetical protein
MPELTEKGLYDIYSVWHVPFWQTKAFFITIATIISMLLITIIWLIVLWYRKKRANAKESWQLALEQLQLLQQKMYLSKEDGKQCYFAMTHIIKTYLIIRFSYPLHGKTDEEMIRYLAASTHQKALVDELKEIMEGALYIKFANEQAMQETIKKHLEQCCMIIERTIPEKQKTQ